MAIYMWREHIPQELCFTANTAGSTVQLTKTGSPTAVTLETSTDGETWSTYTIGNTITLSNIGDKVYWRNTSETTTGFSNGSARYTFVMSGSIAASGDITYLINKNGTDNMSTCLNYLFESCSALTTPPELPATTLSSSNCYQGLFQNCTSLTTCPELPATTLTSGCYNAMFRNCYELETLPKLPATQLYDYSYQMMFYNCSKIKISATQTGEYQTAYRIPTSGTGAIGSYSLNSMFYGTGGTFTGTPTINTTYYTSNTVV